MEIKPQIILLKILFGVIWMSVYLKFLIFIQNILDKTIIIR